MDWTDLMKRANSPMQLTRAADYGVRVMIHLATAPADERVSLPELAESADAPESFLSKVLQGLARAELISSRRGHAGGFAITSRGLLATLREVIEAIDGPICLNECMVDGRSCHRKTWCPAHPVWARAQRAMLDVLSKATVSGMAAELQPVRLDRSASLARNLHAPEKATGQRPAQQADSPFANLR
jgi:Rrf2 family protein